MPINNRNEIKKFRPGVLTIILIVSVVLRVIPALIFGNSVVELPGTSDQASYHALAQRVLAGNGFSFDQNWWPATRAGEPTAHWSFLYTLFLVATYALFGIQPVAARIIQAVIVGVLHPFLVYKIGSELVDRKTGIIAAGITAVYAYFIYYSAVLMTEPFYITTILAAIYLAIQMTSPGLATRRKFWLAVGLGAVLGLTVLLRQLIIIFIPFMLIWVAWREWKRRWWVLIGELILPAAVVGLMILPFTLYNYQRFNQFVLLNTNSGYAFFFGNHPIYGTHFVPILTPEMGTYHDLIPTELLSLDEAAMDKALMKQAVSFILADPLRYLLLSLSRIPIYFQFWPSSSSGLVSNLTRVASFGLFLPFMLVGLGRWVITGGFRRISNPSWLLLLFMLFYAGIHILTWALIRYRLPIDAILIIFASIAVQDLYSFIRNKRLASTAPEKP